MVGVLLLPLHTLHFPLGGRGSRDVAGSANAEDTLANDELLVEPDLETVMLRGVTGVSGVSGEFCTGGNSSLGSHPNSASKGQAGHSEGLLLLTVG